MYIWNYSTSLYMGYGTQMTVKVYWPFFFLSYISDKSMFSLLINSKCILNGNQWKSTGLRMFLTDPTINVTNRIICEDRRVKSICWHIWRITALPVKKAMYKTFLNVINNLNLKCNLR